MKHDLQSCYSFVALGSWRRRCAGSSRGNGSGSRQPRGFNTPSVTRRPVGSATSIPNQQAASASGSLTYAKRQRTYPFTMEYGGRIYLDISGTKLRCRTILIECFYRRASTGANGLSMSSDDASYLPQTPTTGFSGIPGIGEPIGVPNPSLLHGQSILYPQYPCCRTTMPVGALEHTLCNATTVTCQWQSLIVALPEQRRTGYRIHYRELACSCAL